MDLGVISKRCSPAPPALVDVLVLVLAVALLVRGGAVVGGNERLGLLFEQPDDLVRGGGRDTGRGRGRGRGRGKGRGSSG